MVTTAAREKVEVTRGMIEVLDPSAKAQRDEMPIAQRVNSLDGKTVGFLDNIKPNFSVFLDKIEELLKANYNIKGVIRRRKINATTPATEQTIKELASQCQVVITGSGDWGACTSWSVHDAVEMEKRGVPTALVCTNEFVTLGDAEADSLGIPSLPMVVIAHPLGGLQSPEVHKKAEGAFKEIVYVLTGNTEKLSKEYKEKVYPPPKSGIKRKQIFD